MCFVNQEKNVTVSTLDGTITRRGPDGQKVQITSRCAEINNEVKLYYVIFYHYFIELGK